MTKPVPFLLLALLVTSCGDDEPAAPDACLAELEQTPTTACGSGVSSGCLAPVQIDYTLNGRCAEPVADPSRMLIVADDFSTGTLSVVDVATRTVTQDVAVASTDAVPFVHGDALFLVNRFGFDRIDQFDLATFAIEAQYSVASACGDANPQALAFDDTGLGYLTSLGDADVVTYDFGLSVDSAATGRISLASFADNDGVPEASEAFSCGNIVFVAAQRLTPDFQCTAPNVLVPIDTQTGTPLEQSVFTLLGWLPRVILQDPADSSGHSVLALTTGIEQIDLASGEVCWLASEDDFAAVGIQGFQLQDFALHGDEAAYVSAYTSDFSAVSIWRVSLSGQPNLTEVITGLNARERTLEIVGDELWFGDTTVGAEGVRVYDLTEDPPVLIAGPLDAGLPPTVLTPLP